MSFGRHANRTAYHEIIQYGKLLRAHDWHFEHSADQRVWREGKLQLECLNNLQERLDPSFEIWNSYAPEGFKRQPRTHSHPIPQSVINRIQPRRP